MFSEDEHITDKMREKNTLLYQCAQSVEEKWIMKVNEDLVKHKEEHAKERGTPDEAVPSTSHFSHDTSQQEGCGDEAVPSSSQLSHDTSQQEGCGDEDAYEIHLKSSKTFKNKAMENVYGVTFNEKWRGQRLLDIHASLMKMFEDVIREATEEWIRKTWVEWSQHPDVEPIVVSLRPIEEITIRCPEKKPSEIVNDDNLCLARAIAVCWAKQNVCPRGEWRKITKERKGRSNLQLILDTGKMPSTHYENLRKKNSREQRELAAALTSKVGLPLDRPCTITDISVFEDVLHLRILVIDSSVRQQILSNRSTVGQTHVSSLSGGRQPFPRHQYDNRFLFKQLLCMKCLKTVQ
ncbi:unnamed protein product [Mytilus edulis]|uniref:Uncharacterized protein n=1 Tax=Mytilus edulis TaxID=6550 RepID=A0A8S3QY27_MYTED|nr:unnamed protein product [Mytilus edulis]